MTYQPPIKMRRKSYRDLRQKPLPMKMAQNIRHSLFNREISPEWRASDSMMSGNLRLLEYNP